ncbi:glycosyl hydrolase [Desertivirga arenae]|uniref:glycosyl hydrolase n=1 Tax=Desertivirga arenae TaxID=2810309 RepID=UPI001A963DD9|nr:glycosyl hydrolase [Pedobacter sp. SYSU D00823]
MSFKGKHFLVLTALLSLFSQLRTYSQTADSAKPWVAWYWVQAAVSKEGITADLEAMKQAGIAGAFLMPVKGAATPPVYSPAAEQLSPLWWEMVIHSLKEADRLGLKIGMHIGDGFSLAGGPWITPELSMQKIVASKTLIAGGKSLKINLPQPETKVNYYRDIAVYAFPSIIGSGVSSETTVPKVSTSTGAEASFLVQKGNKQAFRSGEPVWIQYAFEKPFTARSVFIHTDGNNVQAHRLKIEISDDGKVFRPVTRLEPPRHGWQDSEQEISHSIKPTTAKFFRFSYNPEGTEPGSEDMENAKWKPSLKLVGLTLSAEPVIHQFEGKSGAIWRVSKRSTPAEISKDLCIPLNKVINLTNKVNADGSLTWNAPKGNWTILRIGHTSTGQTNATGGAARGLECDKFNPDAIKLHFDNWFGEAVRRAGPSLTPRVLNTFFMDSWECGSQNWSPVFKDEFKKRRGYDLIPYLPVMVGLPVEDIETSEKVLYDVRKTIAELVVDKFYGTVAPLVKEKGLHFITENVAPIMVSDGLAHYKKVDMPMGEFWLNSPTHDKPNDMLDAINGGHIYGKNIIGAESFTTVRMAWNEHPGMLKTLQDLNYSLGLNKVSYHVFVQNPWLDRKPGMTLDGVGLYFQRDQTWWKPGKAWVEYAERCQQLLQKGRPVADIAAFIGEELPRRSILPDRLVPVLPGLFGKDVVEAEAKRLANVGQPMRQLPAGVNNSANRADPENWANPLRGYAYDSFNPDVLSTATVKNGNVVFESGASYKLLVIPGRMAMNPNSSFMSIEVASKLLELLKEGATILMIEKPLEQPGLQQADKAAFQKVVDEIWNGNYKGKLLKGPYQQETLSSIGLERDFIVTEGSGNYARKIAYTHRQNGAEEIYFISNQEDRERTLNLSLRGSKAMVEIYDAVSNKRWLAEHFSTEAGRTSLDIRLDRNASLFIILKEGNKAASNQNARNWKEYSELKAVTGAWKVQFDPKFYGPEKAVEFRTLTDWSASADTLIKYYSGTAIYKTNFKADKVTRPVFLDLGEVANLAEVKVNGVSCGVVWTAPYRLDITSALKKGNNELIIEVTNTWANRLMGDRRLPEAERLTKTTAPYRLEGAPLQKAGLLGPVRLLEEK